MPVNHAQTATLSFNGTDTYFQPVGYISNYPLASSSAPSVDRSETISFIAASITRVETGAELDTQELFQKCPALKTTTDFVKGGGDLPLTRLQSPLEARLIEGPNTLGTLVYQKIAEGTASLLGSILEGRTTLNIQGHSRGAIEAILVAHELDRIKQTLNEQKEQGHTSQQLLNIICESPESRIKKELNALLSPLLNCPGALEQLKTRFTTVDDDIRVNLCLLDPVPGNSVLNIPGIGWYDERYFKIPGIVENAQVTICENEDTAGFDCVIPEAIYPKGTHVNVHKLWGHHGTLTGNPFGNNGESLESLGVAEGTAEHAQHVALYESYDFLSSNGTEFKAMPHSCPLAEIYNAYHVASPRRRKTLLLNAYDNMKQNQPAYKALNETVYITVAWFPFHEAFTKPYKYTTKTRPVLESVDHKRSSLDVRLPFKSDQFVNEVHAQLFLDLTLGLDLDTEQRLFQKMEALLDHLESEDYILELNQGLSDETTRKSAIDGIQSLVAKLVQLYLQNNLSAEEKRGTLDAINRALRIHLQETRQRRASLSAAEDVSSNSVISAPSLDLLIDSLKDHLNEHLIDQIETQVNAHYDDLRQLIISMRTELTEGEVLPELAEPADQAEREVLAERVATDEARKATSFVTSAIAKYTQFKSFQKHLIDLKMNIPDSSQLNKILPEKIKRLEIYADATAFFCAKTIHEKQLSIASALSDIAVTDESREFQEQATNIFNGLSRRAPELQEQILILEEQLAERDRILTEETSRYENRLAQQEQAVQMYVTQLAEQNAQNQATQRQLASELESLSIRMVNGIDNLRAELTQRNEELVERNTTIADLRAQITQLNEAHATQLTDMLLAQQQHRHRIQANFASAASDVHVMGLGGMSLQLISGFVTVLGAGVVALALTALAMSALSTFPGVVMITGGVALMSFGMFGISRGARGTAYNEADTLLSAGLGPVA